MAPDFDLAMPSKVSRFIDSVLGLITELPCRTRPITRKYTHRACYPYRLPGQQTLGEPPLIRWISVCYGHSDVGESPCDGWVNNGGKH